MKLKCVTLGCKLNYYESCALSEALVARDYELVKDGPADVVLINSCAVTSRAGMQSRQRVRKEISANPGALVLITGCYAQYDPQGCAAIDGLAAVVGNPGKVDLPAWVVENIGQPKNEVAVFGLDGQLPVAALRALGTMGRTRTLIKIQDGCDSYCSYCIIPFLRQRSRSLAPAMVMAEISELLVSGCSELVLTGVHLGQYGLDLQPQTSLTSLLRQLNDFPDLRLRLGSLQPPEITREIIELIIDEQNAICEHLHLSLQSVVDQVLLAMGRRYTRQQIIQLVENIKRQNSRVTLGADLIVGFPTESGADFNETCALLADLPLDYLHVFPFSPRSGTKAAAWRSRSTPGEIKNRVTKIKELDRLMKIRCYNNNINVKHEVLFEKVVSEADRQVWLGHTRNYLRVKVIFAGSTGKDIFAGLRYPLVPDACDRGNFLLVKKD